MINLQLREGIEGCSQPAPGAASGTQPNDHENEEDSQSDNCRQGRHGGPAG
jgi:hypothetical protein